MKEKQSSVNGYSNFFHHLISLQQPFIHVWVGIDKKKDGSLFNVVSDI